MKNIAVILSGSGVFDGAELHESVLTLLALAKAGVSYQCFAPNINQLHVVNHLTGEVSEGEQRNVLVEAARIARGDIQDLAQLDAKNFSALVVPGGFGAAKNLSDFAVNGSGCAVEANVLVAAKQFADLKKPAAYLCIAPALLPQIYGADIEFTIGNDKETADAIMQMGGKHINCAVDSFVYDQHHRVLTTPAYMLGQNIAEIAVGIEATINELVGLCE
ncbi:isoprenoid biosynthesis glyoxalase ElbB [Psychrobium sp. 1_MG-2023]|uniref:isoprenoid biosynthesis glyoxalase ElbB n=1 Tax=Psychrobium sp. 1_MG-2023 TaxID=3062624 RepID=UPI000C32AC00|nr:isoprenoid biosynthesis glyoxalase ElbB [Psychrobium sp. 1_MG-2023]MDP2560839.1 isoprenoid biosynthesis glyoxalase ElbB [Psychrobium sp. 1_MG-2023]PKF56713.1 isoprenoid biosynthesis protein ElbB [Alteromonadales bacterium alter-6D02]